MRRTSGVSALSGLVLLLSAVLATLLVAPGAQAGVAGDDAAPSAGKGKIRTSISLRLAPRLVTVFANGAKEKAAAIVQVLPANSGRVVHISRSDGTTLTARTDDAGRAYWPTDSSQLVAGATYTYQATVSATAYRTSAGPVSAALHTVSNEGGCKPSPELVDRGARGEAYCLAARLDRWKTAHVMGVGQEINVASKPWTGPLTALGSAQPPAVIGFDLEELEKAATYSTGTYEQEVIDDLVARAHDGAVLEASWHAPNPFYPGKPAQYTKRGPLSNLLDLYNRANPAAKRFWDSWDAVLDLVKQFQDRPDPTDPTAACWCTPLIVRPLHEPNGDFFWWGKPDPTTYKTLFGLMQTEAYNKGVHNIVWAYAGNRDTSSTTDPTRYVPGSVDIGGLDTYDPEFTKPDAPDRLGLEGWSGISKMLPRGALTETGPQGSLHGKWNPATITRVVRAAKIRPTYAMLWFDDGTPTASDQSPGKKQIASLSGGKAWLRSCYQALCYLG